MKSSSQYGLALIVGTIAQLVTMSFHPTGIGALTSPDVVAHEMRILIALHALALLGVPLVVFGLAGVTRRIGWEQPVALFAFVVYAFSAVAIMFAAIADGLVNAALVPQMVGAPEPALQTLKAVLSYNFQFNQACAKVYVVGSSLAIILWSVSLMRLGAFERVIAFIGWFAGTAALAGLLSGHVRMSAHGFGLIVFLQGAWVVALGISMLRTGSTDSLSQVAAHG
jgi:hypothetical protein